MATSQPTIRAEAIIGPGEASLPTLDQLVESRLTAWAQSGRDIRVSPDIYAGAMESAPYLLSTDDEATSAAMTDLQQDVYLKRSPRPVSIIVQEKPARNSSDEPTYEYIMRQLEVDNVRTYKIVGGKVVASQNELADSNAPAGTDPFWRSPFPSKVDRVVALLRGRPRRIVPDSEPPYSSDFIVGELQKRLRIAALAGL